VGVETRILAAKIGWLRRVRNTPEEFDGADIAPIVYATGGKLYWTRLFELGRRSLGNVSVEFDLVSIHLSGTSHYVAAAGLTHS